MGKTDVEDAIQRLDTLTEEENLMTAARTFEATHHVDNVDNKVTVLTYDIKEGTRNVDYNVKVAKHGTPMVSVSL